MNAILPNILEIIITIISLVVARYLIPYIKTDFIPWLKEKRILNLAKNFVQAAEKMAEAGMIDKEEKKEKVIELLRSKGIVIDDVTDAFIESLVKELDIVTSVVYEGIVEAEIETEEN